MSALLKPTPAPHVSRRYSVFACEDGSERAHTITGDSYEDAAIRFVEEWCPAIDAGEVFVVVTDCETGRVQSLRVDIGDIAG